MKNKNYIRPKTSIKLSLKRVAVAVTILTLITGVIWKVFLGTVATVINPDNAKAILTPSTGPQITGYNWLRLITIDHTQVMDTTDLVDFPFLVSLTEQELRSVSNGGGVESLHGYDIIFSGLNDAQLDHQIEFYDPVTGTYVAWIRLPILYANTNTEITISWGNSSVNNDPSTENVWNNTYEAVWHMNTDPTSLPIEDGVNNSDAYSYGNMSTNNLVPGQIGPSIEFDGSNDYMAIKNKYYNSTSAMQQMTVSAWVNTSYNNSGWTSNWSILDFDRSEYFNFFVHGEGKISFSTRSSVAGIHDFHGGQNGQINNGQWHYVVGSYDGNNKYLYIDGVLVNTSIGSHNGASLGSGTARYGFIGEGSEASSFNGSRNGKYYQGKLDEIRLQNTHRSQGWIATEFNNQSSPNSFYTLGIVGALPIELVAFNAELEGKVVYIDWATASQRNNDFFTVERSIDGNLFKPVGEIDGVGNSEEYLEYFYIDSEPFEGLSYYRLRQTDFDGKFEVFNAVAVNYQVPIEKIEIKSIGPNPFNDHFTVNFLSDKNTQVTFTLTSSSGLRVFSDDITLHTGLNEYYFSQDHDLKPGTYFFSAIQNEQILATYKLIKN